MGSDIMISSVNYLRQADLVDVGTLRDSTITIIGAGAVGSFTILTLAKMGVGHVEVYDNDGINDHNLPNQFFRIQDIDQHKVHALRNIVLEFSDAEIRPFNELYNSQLLAQTVIVATDTMSSRRIVWEQFNNQLQCSHYIEARMGAELGRIYTISKKDGKIADEDINFYESVLVSDNTIIPLRCTARAIIYNVLMIASLICRSYKGIIQNEKIPREQVFNMQEINRASFMVRI